jgi:alkylation response protein AidB-like acyl-CoA dehydrogenase
VSASLERRDPTGGATVTQDEPPPHYLPLGNDREGMPAIDPLADGTPPDYVEPIRREARAFVNDHVEPVVEEYYAAGEYPWEVLEAGQDAGLVAADVAEEYGGRGLDLSERLALIEELFRGDAGIGLTMQLASFAAEAVEAFGTEEQKERLLRPVAEGDQLSGLGASEPQTGSDLAGMQARAERDGDGYVLNGEKYWVSNGVEADWVLLYCRTDDGPDRHGNHALFAVPTGAPGYEAEHIPEKMGLRASKQGHVVLDDCRVPEENLVGEEGQGFEILARFFNPNRVVVAGHALGPAAAAIEAAWEFVHDREAFSQSVAEFQSVKHDLADMLAEFSAARTLAYEAAERVEADPYDGKWASMAKLRASETAVDVAERAMQLHGGRSVFTDSRVSRVWRDVHVTRVYEGVNEVQRTLIYKRAATESDQDET